MWFGISGVGYLLIISAKSSQRRSISAKPAPPCRRAGRAPRRGLRFRCQRSWVVRALTSGFVALAVAGGASAALEKHTTQPASSVSRPVGGDIATQWGSAPRLSPSRSGGITSSAPAGGLQKAPGAAVEPPAALPRASVVSPRSSFAIPHLQRQVSSVVPNFAPQMSGVSSFTSWIPPRTSVRMHDRIAALTHTRKAAIGSWNRSGGAVLSTAASRPTAPAGGDDSRDTEQMLRIGGALGFGYVGFLVCWFWATRVRPAVHRGARA
jgi:hypothetical protein